MRGLLFTDSIKRTVVKGANWSWVAIGMTAACAQGADPATVARGEYIARIGDCVSCHTAGPGRPLFAGGLPIMSPFGTIYSTNITPDPASGIGQYTYPDFSRAVREGIAKDGRRLYPAMPYASFAAVSDSDMQALYAYFMEGVKAVNHTPPETRLPFPFNQRWALTFWSAAFVNQERYKTRSDRTSQWNRGAYLVQTLGHCGACHTPRGFAYQEKAYSELSSDYLSGAVVDNWFAANLTGSRASGLGRWSQTEISMFLETGHSADQVAFGSMVAVIENSTQHMRKDDLDAIAHYLKSLPARKEKPSFKSPTSSAMPAGSVLTSEQFELPGAGVYAAFCAKCHRDNGTGKPPRIPKLGGNSMVVSVDTSSLIRQMLEGGKGPRTKKGPEPKEMPSFGKKLTDRDIAEVLTYVRNNWGNTADAVTPRAVSTIRKALQK